MERYRKKRKKVDQLNTIKNDEINLIMEQIDSKPFNLKLYLKYLLMPILILIISILVYPLMRDGSTPSKPKTSLYKVSAQEYRLESGEYKLLFKAFAITNNDEIIRFNDDFSYYKGMSKYKDLSHLIGNEIDLNLQLIEIKNHNFIELNAAGNVTYYEIIVSDSYFSISGFDGYNFNDFRNEMTEVIELIADYPPEGEPTNYRPNKNISEVTDQQLVKRYTKYIENTYIPPVDESELNSTHIVSYVFNIDQNENDNTYTIKDNFISSHQLIGDPRKMNIEQGYFHPIEDGYEIILNYDYTYGALTNSNQFENEQVKGAILFKKYIASTNEQFNDVPFAKLYIRKDQMAKDTEVGRIVMINRDNGNELEFDLIENNEYIFSMPVLLRSDLVDLVIYDLNGKPILEKPLSIGSLSISRDR